MFRLKVIGHTQSLLFDRLYHLYIKGIPCLLLSFTVGKYLNYAILNETLKFPTEESRIRSQTDLEMLFCQEIRLLYAIAVLFRWLSALISQVELMLGGILTVYQRAIIQYLTSIIFRSAALMIQERVQHNKRNKKNIYMKRKAVLSLFKFSSIVGGVSDILYLAMYFTKTASFCNRLGAYKERRNDYLDHTPNIIIVSMQRCTLVP